MGVGDSMVMGCWGQHADVGVGDSMVMGCWGLHGDGVLDPGDGGVGDWVMWVLGTAW